MARRDSSSALTHFAETLALVSQGRPGHIVDTLIAERGEKIVHSPFWPVMRPFLYSLLGYGKAIEFATETQSMDGYGVFNYLSEKLTLDIHCQRRERIPEAGGFIMVSNHPTGIADGVAVFDLLKDRRPDMMFFANRDAVRVNPRLVEMIVPVEWREEFKSKLKARETLQVTNDAIRQEKAMVLFPSGRIAYWAEGKLNERPWKNSAIGFARKYNLPILPVHLKARNSGLFYWFAKWSTELRDMTVFHELLNKKGDRFDFTIGKMIMPEELNGDAADVTTALENHTVHALAKDPDADFVLPPAEPKTEAATEEGAA